MHAAAPSFGCDCWKYNSGLYDCVASTLLTEPCPYPFPPFNSYISGIFVMMKTSTTHGIFRWHTYHRYSNPDLSRLILHQALFTLRVYYFFFYIFHFLGEAYFIHLALLLLNTQILQPGFHKESSWCWSAWLCQPWHYQLHGNWLDFCCV